MKLMHAALATRATMLAWLAGAALAGACGAALAQAAPVPGQSLYDDVRTYADFGVHRYGTPGEQAAQAWIARELAAAGFKVERQPLRMKRQLVTPGGTLTLDGKTYPAFPHWWPPAALGHFVLEAPLKPDRESAGALAWLRLPYERGAYLNAERKRRILAVAAYRPRAILLTIDNPAGSIFTYNVTQEDARWPVPVIVVPARLAAALEAARDRGSVVKVDLSATDEHDVRGYNVIGRIDRGAARTVVVSTPVSSWFTSSCERGPGIALFLALARHVAATRHDVNYVFVATVGHEIGHGGMEAFLRDQAPPPARTRAWLHLGASLGCYGWKHDVATGTWTRLPDADPALRAVLASPSMQAPVAAAFAGVAALRMFGDQAAVGELRNVRAAGYANYFGMAGLHRYFHTPEDSAALTGPELLEPLDRAFTKVIDEVSAD
ncbi:MAG: hypothetical protein KGI36_15535 [Burkholderiales bacterium]|nr:hypothetical protein [Burkholderiales bacterium]